MTDTVMIAGLVVVLAVLGIMGLALIALDRASDTRLDRYPGGRMCARRDALIMGLPAAIVFSVVAGVGTIDPTISETLEAVILGCAILAALGWHQFPFVKRSRVRFGTLVRVFA